MSEGQDRASSEPLSASLSGPEAVLANLDPEQREVALAARGPVCVLAGAGTGKTRAVAHRIAYLAATAQADPARVLAVTFTTRAAGELRGRLRQLGQLVPGTALDKVQARTFHSAALRQLTHFWPATVGGAAPRVLESKISLLAEVARRLQISAGLPELRDAASEIEWAKVTQVRPDEYVAASTKAGRTPPLDAVALARIYASYEELRTERHLVDFESVLELTAAILAEYPVAARSVRDRYTCFVVDEYQDVNPLQKLLLDMWLGGRDEICVVGDPRQTIYSFTGATPAYLTGFPAEFPAARVIRLVRNYRSTPEVVALANKLVAAAGRSGPGSLVAQRPAGPAARLTEHADEPAEAADVARQVRTLVKAGTPAAEIAVLVRTNAQTAAYEQALADAGVPFQLRGAERFFDRDEVRQAVGLLRAAARSATTGDDPAAEVRPILASIGLTARPPGGRGTARDRWESLEALAQLAAAFFVANPEAGLADLSAELAVRSAIGHAPAMAGVTLASLHSAKGLEWQAVFLAGLTDGTVPIVYAQTDEAVEEERRLLYVGITRARERLYLSWALARTPGGRRTRRPSRFLADLSGRGVRASERAAAGRRSGSPASRPEGAGPAPGDPLFGRLREWRLAVSKEQGVPAYVVFSDATLQAIAAARPASRSELAGIPGVGAVKLDRYGAAVLELCAAAAPPAAAGGQAAQ
ncbi:MAG TPA: ATP-dependent DNA helicase UvrD2 [Streptosporangiaceae bacterium]|nr:ATP-dependent DNA helicase UvrD2 [Streptosporangiaceae bacterium]